MANSHASALIIVIVAMTFFSVVLLGLWRSMSMAHDVAWERYRYYKAYQSVQNMHGDAIQYVQQNFNILVQDPQYAQIPHAKNNTMSVLLFDKQTVILVRTSMPGSPPLVSFVRERYIYDRQTKKKHRAYVVQPCFISAAL